MANTAPLNIITGKTGTAHISSDDDASIWRGLVGSNNVVLFTDDKLAFVDNGKQNDDGSLTIKDGVFSIKNGHMGRIDGTATLTYSLPNEGSYRRTLVIIRYAKDGNQNESMTLMTIQSNPQNDTSSATSAATLDYSIDSTTDYILYDFVCGSDGLVNNTLQTKLTVIDTIPQMIDRIVALETFKTQEISDRTAVTNRVRALENVHHTFITKLNDSPLSLENNDDTTQQFETTGELCLITFTRDTPYGGADAHNKSLLITPEKTYRGIGGSANQPINHEQLYELDRTISDVNETVYYAKIRQDYYYMGSVHISVVGIIEVATTFGTQTVETGTLGSDDTVTINTFSRTIRTNNDHVYVNIYKVEL